MSRVKSIQHSLELSREDAYMMASMVMDVEISQLVNPRKTVRVKIPWSYANIESILHALSMRD